MCGSIIFYGWDGEPVEAIEFDNQEKFLKQLDESIDCGQTFNIGKIEEDQNFRNEILKRVWRFELLTPQQQQEYKMENLYLRDVPDEDFDIWFMVSKEFDEVFDLPF